jgi:hypothetical protein
MISLLAIPQHLIKKTQARQSTAIFNIENLVILIMHRKNQIKVVIK